MESIADTAWVTTNLRLNSKRHSAKPNTAILNKTVATKWLLMIFCCTHRVT